MILVKFLIKFGVLGILCRFFTAYSIANYLLIIIIREKRADVLQPISRYHVVSVRRGFFFLLVLGKAALFYFGPPWTVLIIKVFKVQIFGTC